MVNIDYNKINHRVIVNTFFELIFYFETIKGTYQTCIYVLKANLKCFLRTLADSNMCMREKDVHKNDQ